MKTIAVITALNENDTIRPLVATLQGFCDAVIVVDDGSNDGTGQIARGEKAFVIRHETPKGIAASLMEAWKLALDMGADRVLQIDAGGSHNPLELHNITDKYDVVVGSRFCEGARYIGGWRGNFSRAYAKLCNWAIAGYVVSDWTSGFRVFSRHALEVLLLPPAYWTNGHTWQAEVIHRALKRRLSISEVPITYRAGRSSMTWKEIDEAILIWLKVMNL
jgi:dolichol-phosphate mannosyltransferase